MQIIDAVTFGGEIDMLEGRLETLGEHIDKMVIVESDKMYAGTPKEYTFEQNEERFAKWRDKILYIKIKSNNSPDAWENDYAQRRALKIGLDQLDLKDDDLVCITDTDEWWDYDLIKYIDYPTAFNMPKYHMSLHWFHKFELTGIVAPWWYLKDKDVNYERWRRAEFGAVTGGWHLTSMGNYEYLVRKVKGFAHQEFNKPGLEEALADCWTNGHDLANEYYKEIEFDETFPKWIREHKFPELWYRKRPKLEE